MNNNLVWLWVPLITGVAAIVFAIFLANWVMSQDRGTKEMQRVAGYIYQGAQAFLRRQYQTIAMYAIGVAIIIGIVLALLPKVASSANVDQFTLGWHTSVAFLIGAICSGMAGFIGMLVAVQSNVRVASAAQKSLGQALIVALRGGAVTGFLVIALSVLGVTLVYIIFGGLHQSCPNADTDCWLRVWRELCGAVCPAWRRHLYQSGGCGRRPRRQSRGRHP